MKRVLSFLVALALACAARAGQVETTVYASPGGIPLALDSRIPDGAGPFPAVVIVHGGGWGSGDKESEREVKPILEPLSRGGFAWFSVNYRLSKQAKYPACIEDVEAAIQYVKAHAKEYRIDPDKVAILGDSAGGHIVDMVAMRASPDKPERKIAAVVSFFGPNDLVEDSFRRNANSPSLQALFGLPATPLDDRTLRILENASPIAYVNPNLPPFLLLHGTADQSVDYRASVTLKRDLDALGVPCRLITIPKGIHVMANWDEMKPPQTAYKEEVVDWLHSVFNRVPMSRPVATEGEAKVREEAVGTWHETLGNSASAIRLDAGGTGASLSNPACPITWDLDSQGRIHIQYPAGQGRDIPYSGSPDLTPAQEAKIENAGVRPKVDFADWRYFRTQDLMISSNGEIFLRESPGKNSETESLSYNVRGYGALGDGTTLDTRAFQKALDTCAVNGGGEVVVPAGTYLIGSIQIGTHTILRLLKDSVLKGSPDLSNYPICDVRWEGRWQPGRRGLIYAANVDHIGIVGPGSIEGTPTPTNSPNGTRNPVVIEPISCSDVVWEGFSVKQGGNWATHPTYCTDVAIRNITIRGNRDGIDVDSCKNVLIEGCDISTGDDSISLKSGRGMDGARLGKVCENIRIQDCTLADRNFACLGIGSETSGGVRNVLIQRCKLSAPHSAAIYIKTRIGRAGGNENFTGEGLDVKAQTFLRINLTKGGNTSTSDDPVEGLVGYPFGKNFRFTHIQVACTTLVQANEISALRPLQNFELSDISGLAQKGMTLANIDGIRISNVHVTGLTGPLLGVYNVKGAGLDGAVPIPAPIDPPPGNSTGRPTGPRRTPPGVPAIPPSPPTEGPSPSRT